MPAERLHGHATPGRSAARHSRERAAPAHSAPAPARESLARGPTGPIATTPEPIGAGPYPPRPDPWSSTGSGAWPRADAWTTGSIPVIAPPPALRPSWQRPAQVGGIVIAWLLLVAIASLMSPVGWLRPVALFTHVVFLAVSFGGVLAVGANAIALLMRWVRVGRVVGLATALDPLIWVGLAGMCLSGIVLAPDLGDLWTWVKLLAVLTAALNGLWARDLMLELRRFPQKAGRRALSPDLVRRAVWVSVVAQVGWWTAVIIGFAATNG